MTPTLEGLPTKANKAASPYEVRLAPLETNPVFCEASLWPITNYYHVNDFIFSGDGSGLSKYSEATTGRVLYKKLFFKIS